MGNNLHSNPSPDGVLTPRAIVADWAAPFRLREGEGRALLFMVVVTILYVAVSVWFSFDRGLHTDEVLTVREGKIRVFQPAFQNQHGWFLDFYRVYIASTNELGDARLMWWRLPSVLAGAAGLFIMGLLGMRLVHPAVGAASCVLILALPRFWVSGMEMRFYGFMMLFSSLSLLGVVMVARGRLLGGMTLLGASSLLSYKFHPAAAPFHGVAGIVALLAALLHGWRGLSGLQAWRKGGGAGSFPTLYMWWIVISALCLIGAAGALVKLYPEILQHINSISTRRGNLPHEYMENGWQKMQMINHALSWGPHLADGSMGRYFGWAMGFLLLGGVVSLALSRRYILATALFALWLIPHAITYFLSWHVQFAIKYLTSTLPVAGVLMACALFGLGALLVRVGLPRLTQPMALWLGAALLFAVSLAELPQRLTDDPSGAHRMARIAERDSPTGYPYMMAPVALAAMIEEMTLSDFTFNLNLLERDRVTPEVEAAMLLRPEGFFRAEWSMANLGAIAGFPVDSPAIRVYPEFRSSFNPRYDVTLYGVAAEPVLAGGMAGELVPGKAFALLEGGAWVIDAPADARIEIGGVVYSGGDRLELDGQFCSEWKVTPAATPVSLRPAFTEGHIRRSGHLADFGSVYRYNRAMREIWRLTNNLTIGYTLDMPEEPVWVVIETEGDNLAGHALMVSFPGNLMAELHVNRTPAPGGVVEYVARIPQELLGKRTTLRVTMLAENAVNQDKDENVRTLDIRGLRLEPASGELPIRRETFATALRRVDLPIWPPTEEITAKSQVLGKGENPIELEVHDGELVLSIPPGCDSQAVLLQPFGIPPGVPMVMQCELRAENLVSTSVAAFVAFFAPTGQMVSQVPLSQRVVGRRSTESTWRSGIIQLPADAAIAGLYLYVNIPPLQELEEDARIVVQNIRLWISVNERTGE